MRKRWYFDGKEEDEIGSVDYLKVNIIIFIQNSKKEWYNKNIYIYYTRIEKVYLE